MFRFKALAGSAVAVTAAIGMAGSAQAGGEFAFTGTPGVAETHQWTATGSGIFAAQDITDEVGCAPAPVVHDCDDTVLEVPARGVLTIRSAHEDPASPEAQAGVIDTDLQLFYVEPDGTLTELGESAQPTPTPDEEITLRVPAGTYVARIDYMIALNSAIRGTAVYRQDQVQP